MRIYTYTYMHALPDYIMMHTFGSKTELPLAAAMKSTIPEYRVKPLFYKDCTKHTKYRGNRNCRIKEISIRLYKRCRNA